MRLAFVFGRLCARSGLARGIGPSRAFEHIWKAAFRKPGSLPGRPSWPRHGLARVVLRASGKAALGTAAFVKLSQQDNGGTDETAETRMLEVSRREIQKTVDDEGHRVVLLGRKVMLWLDLYLWEPICTGVRFLHLLVIFVPVMATVPAIWIGRRQSDRDNERSGTLWWYGFLVQSMEWAGPAFIKVSDGARGGMAEPAAC